MVGEGWESRADGQGGAHSVGIGGAPASHPSFLTEGLGQHPPPPHTWPSACPPTLPTLHEIPQRLCHWMTKLAPSELLILHAGKQQSLPCSITTWALVVLPKDTVGTHAQRGDLKRRNMLDVLCSLSVAQQVSCHHPPGGPRPLCHR